MIMKMKQPPDSFFKIAGIVVAGLLVSAALISCAAIQSEGAMDMERTLAAAGFQMKFADTPEKRAHVEALTQRRLVPHERDGKIYYVYADADYCQCIYVGTEKAYQRFQNLALQKKIAEEKLQAAEMNVDAPLDLGMWGPWGPWW